MRSCEVCGENEARYRCPRCQLHTCSLACVKQHKTNTDCSGQRDKTAYTPVSQFTDIHLLSDYRFLEDVGRKSNNAGRDMLKNPRNRPNFVHELQKQAIKRHVDLRLMPYPMSRRKHNKTTYNYKQRQILWQIEWLFPQSDMKLIDRRVLETDTLGEVLTRHTGASGDVRVRHKLSQYTRAESQDWRLYMRVENMPQSEDRYHILDMDRSVASNLERKCVIEYPTIHVVLRKHWHEYKPVADSDPNTEGSSDNTDKVNDGQSTSAVEQSTIEMDNTDAELNVPPHRTETETDNITETETTNSVPLVACTE